MPASLCLRNQELWFKEMKLANAIFDYIFHKVRKYDDNEITLNPMSILGKSLVMYSYIMYYKIDVCIIKI